MAIPNIQIISADITTLEVDAIVNAANAALSGGGGVDGAIHRAAGPKLAAACRKIGGCETGGAVITQGYNLPATYVIHAVGPVWWGGEKNEHALLESCYTRCLDLAVENQIESIAFPAISCGAYRFPIDEAAQIAIDTVRNYCAEQVTGIREIYLVCFDPKVKNAYTKYFEESR